MSQEIRKESSSFLQPSKCILLRNHVEVPKYMPRAPIKYSRDIGDKLRSYFTKVESPYRKNIDPPFEEPLRSEIFRFFVSLDAYIDSKGKIGTSTLLFGQCEGPSFTKYLKRLRVKSLVKYGSGEFLEDSPEFSDISPIPIFDDIGEIFNYQYCIFWEEPDDNDYLNGDLPLKKISIEKITQFKETLMGFLPEKDKVREVSKEEVLLKVTGSKTLSGEKSEENWILAQTPTEPASSIGACKRTFLQVRPGSARDTVLLSNPALLRVKWIDQQLFEILEHLEHHVMVKSPEKATKRLTHLAKNYHYFFHRDIKKEGITKPRQLLKAMLEALYEVYGFEAFRATDFYEDYSLILENGEWFYPKRGHGLGMANALTTLMQITLLTVIKEDYFDYELTFDFLCLNDDLVVGFANKDDMSHFDECEDYLLNDFQIIKEKKKSFSLYERFVLAERYFDISGRECKKHSYKVRELLCVLASMNITHAKQQLNSISHFIDYDILMEYYEEIMSFWGYEFFPEEGALPASCGGWWTSSLNGISLDLLRLNSIEYRPCILHAYEACRFNRAIKPLKKKKLKRLKGRKYKHPVHYAFKNFDLGDLELELFPDNYYQMYSEYHRLYPEEQFTSWELLRKKREKVFRESRTQLPFDKFIELLVKNDSKDYYPLEFMIEKTVKVKEYVEGKLDDIYRSSSPLIEYLLYFNSDVKREGLIKDRFSIHFQNAECISRRLPHDVRRQMSEFLGNISVPFCGSPMEWISIVEEDDLIQQCYIDPQAMSLTHGLLTKMFEIPIIFERFRNPINKEKEEIFNGFVPFSLQTVLQEFLPNRQNIMNLITIIRKLGPDITTSRLQEIIAEIKKKHWEKIDKINNPSDEDDQEIDEKSIPRDTEKYSAIEFKEMSDFWNWRTIPVAERPWIPEFSPIWNDVESFVINATGAFSLQSSYSGLDGSMKSIEECKQIYTTLCPTNYPAIADYLINLFVREQTRTFTAEEAAEEGEAVNNLFGDE